MMGLQVYKLVKLLLSLVGPREDPEVGTREWRKRAERTHQRGLSRPTDEAFIHSVWELERCNLGRCEW